MPTTDAVAADDAADDAATADDDATAVAAEDTVYATSALNIWCIV